MKKLVLLLAAILVIAARAVASAQGGVDKSDWPTVFSFGRFAGDDAANALVTAEPLRAYLERELGIPVTVNVGTTYSAVIAAMAARQMDAMEVGPFSFIIAEREANAEAIAVGASESTLDGGPVVYDPSVRPFYYSVFVNVDGWLQPIFADSHPSAVLALVNGDVDAATTFEGNLINLRNEGQAQVCGFEDDKTGVTLTQDQKRSGVPWAIFSPQQVDPAHDADDVPFASLDLLACIIATLPARFGGFDTLTIDDGRTGLCMATLHVSRLATQRPVDGCPGPIRTPFAIVVVHTLRLGEVLW